LSNVNTTAMLTNVNTSAMLAIVNIPAMPKTLNSATVGAIVRQARTAAGITQTQLAERIGASRFWVAAFEKGKPSAELGLALKAIHALGLAIHIEPKNASAASAQPGARRTNTGETDLANVIARTTLTRTAPSAVIGWPTTASPRTNRSRKS
jgi:DNA-binding XRE family transcriptional regulator